MNVLKHIMVFLKKDARQRVLTLFVLKQKIETIYKHVIIIVFLIGVNFKTIFPVVHFINT